MDYCVVALSLHFLMMFDIFESLSILILQTSTEMSCVNFKTKSMIEGNFFEKTKDYTCSKHIGIILR